MLEPPRKSWRWVLVAGIALFAHGAIVWALPSHLKKPRIATPVVEVDVAKVVAPSQPATSKLLTHVPQTPAAAPQPPTPKSPSAPAHAGALLARNDDAREATPFVAAPTGTYIGGPSAPIGGEAPAPEPAPPQPAPAQAAAPEIVNITTPVVAPHAAPDLSHPPALAIKSWSCPFPAEADAEDVNRAVVALDVRIAADGSVKDVLVAQDPGHGFAREARICARNKKWTPAADKAGNAVDGTARVNVTFER